MTPAYLPSQIDIEPLDPPLAPWHAEDMNKEHNMTRNANNPNFFDVATLVLNNGTFARDYRTLAVADAETVAWDRPDLVDTDNLFAVESFNYPGVFSYAVVEPVARKSTPIGGNYSNGIGYRVRVTFVTEDADDASTVTGWVRA